MTKRMGLIELRLVHVSVGGNSVAVDRISIAVRIINLNLVWFWVKFVVPRDVMAVDSLGDR